MANVSSAFIGIGSNLDDPVSQVERAIDTLGSHEQWHLIKRSQLYSSPPMGPPDQPHYINAVVHLATKLDCRSLLESLQAIERQRGRIRDGERWGPRTLDLDILLFNNDIIDEAGLSVPHPGLQQREFVVLPLFEIAPNLILPDGRCLADLAAVMAADACAKPMLDVGV